MNSSILKNRKILLGITGGIAAYKSAELVRRLTKEGASVQVVMTEASTKFISSLTFETLTGNPVFTDIFSSPLAHIRLPQEADLYLIAPLTANTLSRLAQGMADDMVTACFLSFRGPVLLAPSMNWKMYEHPATVENLKRLKDMGCVVIRPETGELACGEYGKGRMAEVDVLIEEVKSSLCKKDLSGKKVLITAGPTREPIDPVRFISNRSSGRMGFSLARVARRRGAEVVLIAGPTAIAPPHGIKTIRVETASEMFESLKEHLSGADILVMAAAVADYTVKRPLSKKAQKTKLRSLELSPAVDILKEVSKIKGDTFVIGFAAETGPNIAKAKRKLREKKMDMLVFNDVTLKGAGFDTETNRIVIITSKGEKGYPLMSKEDCAEVIFDHYLEMVA